MKTCHACGQKLPLKVGEMVAFSKDFARAHTQPGIVMKVTGTIASVIGLRDGLTYQRVVTTLTRLHGYYRITEREAL